MKCKIKINYNWDLGDYPKLTDVQREQLKEHAEERVFEMRKQGYWSGELHYEDDEISVWGWWDFSEEEEEEEEEEENK